MCFAGITNFRPRDWSDQVIWPMNNVVKKMALPLSKSLSELPEYRHVLANLVLRDLKVKYQLATLGFLWSLLYPAILLGIYFVIFSRVVRFGEQFPHYWALLLSGMIAFQFIQGATVEGMYSIRKNSTIIRKVYVPMEILVIAGVTVKLVEFLLQMAIVITLLAILHHGTVYEFSLFKTLVVLPAAILLAYIFVLGVSLPLAAMAVIYRDLDHIVNLVMLGLFYLTPVFWASQKIKDSKWLPLLAFNPAANLLELFRGPLYFGHWPENLAVGGSPLATWGICVLFSFGALFIGHAMFNRSKHLLAEVV
jgi:lipopolysaccharide transport system permease protein